MGVASGQFRVTRVQPGSVLRPREVAGTLMEKQGLLSSLKSLLLKAMHCTGVGGADGHSKFWVRSLYLSFIVSVSCG